MKSEYAFLVVWSLTAHAVVASRSLPVLHKGPRRTRSLESDNIFVTTNDVKSGSSKSKNSKSSKNSKASKKGSKVGKKGTVAPSSKPSYHQTASPTSTSRSASKPTAKPVHAAQPTSDDLSSASPAPTCIECDDPFLDTSRDAVLTTTTTAGGGVSNTQNGSEGDTTTLMNPMVGMPSASFRRSVGVSLSLGAIGLGLLLVGVVCP